MASLPISNVKRLLGQGAKEMRISAESVTVAIEATEEYLGKLGERAASVARSYGRKTIMPEDLAQARKLI